MLSSLWQIVQSVNAAPNLEQALKLIVRSVKENMSTHVCSVYLFDEEQKNFVLMATEGLNPEAVGQVRMSEEEGLVGLVAKRAEPINLDQADQHPRYRYFPETGEEQYASFLGVPIIHQQNILGVLVD